MASFSLIAAFVSAILVSLFSGFHEILPILLFAFLLVFNCECAAANACDEDKTSMMFMAILSSFLVVLLCGVVMSSCINGYLCDHGYLDPDLVHPAAPVITAVLTLAMYRVFLYLAGKNRLTVQKFGMKLKKVIDEHTYNPRLKRFRRMMIKEGTLTERMPDDDDDE
jgi:cytochrome bd-type quinol oxidase subunit 2